jgi:hypothetical protein
MPRKSGPRTVTAGEVVNYFEQADITLATTVLQIVKDRMAVRVPKPTKAGKRAKVEKIPTPTLASA